EMVEAKAIIKNEFRIENQETLISDTSAENSLLSIQITVAQINKKQMNKTTLDRAILFQVCKANFISTYEMIIRGTTVSNVFTMLNIMSPLPVSSLSIKSLATKTSEVAPCSKLMKKKIKKKASNITPNILSRTTLS